MAVDTTAAATSTTDMPSTYPITGDWLLAQGH